MNASGKHIFRLLFWGFIFLGGFSARAQLNMPCVFRDLDPGPELVFDIQLRKRHPESGYVLHLYPVNGEPGKEDSRLKNMDWSRSLGLILHTPNRMLASRKPEDYNRPELALYLSEAPDTLILEVVIEQGRDHYRLYKSVRIDPVKSQSQVRVVFQPDTRWTTVAYEGPYVGDFLDPSPIFHPKRHYLDTETGCILRGSKILFKYGPCTLMGMKRRFPLVFPYATYYNNKERKYLSGRALIRAGKIALGDFNTGDFSSLPFP